MAVGVARPSGSHLDPRRGTGHGQLLRLRPPGSRRAGPGSTQHGAVRRMGGENQGREPAAGRLHPLAGQSAAAAPWCKPVGIALPGDPGLEGARERDGARDRGVVELGERRIEHSRQLQVVAGNSDGCRAHLCSPLPQGSRRRAERESEAGRVTVVASLLGQVRATDDSDGGVPALRRAQGFPTSRVRK